MQVFKTTYAHTHTSSHMQDLESPTQNLESLKHCPLLGSNRKWPSSHPSLPQWSHALEEGTIMWTLPQQMGATMCMCSSVGTPPPNTPTPQPVGLRYLIFKIFWAWTVLYGCQLHNPAAYSLLMFCLNRDIALSSCSSSTLYKGHVCLYINKLLEAGFTLSRDRK